MSKVKMAMAAAAVLLSSGMVSGSASAMPANGLTPTITQTAGSVEKVRWVCGPYRCWWGPGPYWPGRPVGWRGGWGWHGWGWHGGWGWRGHRW
jgi:hypothetical protein